MRCVTRWSRELFSEGNETYGNDIDVLVGSISVWIILYGMLFEERKSQKRLRDHRCCASSYPESCIPRVGGILSYDLADIDRTRRMSSDR